MRWSKRSGKPIAILIALGLVLSLGLMALPAVSPVAASPTVIHVYDGESIQAAIDAATPGDTVIVHQGTYTESLTIDKSLTVRSSSGADRTTIEGTVTIDIADQETVVFGRSGGGFEVNGTSPGFNVTLEYWSQLTIQGNLITGNTDEGIYVSRVWYGSTLFILDNQITDNTGDGIYIPDGIADISQGLIEGNTISGNDDGIFIDDGVGEGSQIDIIDNRITDNTGDGIYIFEINEASHGLIENNTISQTQSKTITGAQIGTGWGTHNFELNIPHIIYGLETIYLDGIPTTDYTIDYPRDSIRFHTAPGSGVAITADFTVGGGGIYIGEYGVNEGSSLTVRDNQITQNDSEGIGIYKIDEGSQSLIEGNIVTENNDGIYIKYYGIVEDSSLTIRDNQITQNTSEGIYIYELNEGSQALIEGNTISQAHSTPVAGKAVGIGDDNNEYFELGIPSIVPDSETIYLDGSPTTDYTFEYGTGDIMFDSPPGSSVAITADYEVGGWGISIYSHGVNEGSLLTIRDNRITESESGGIYLDEVDEGSQAIIEDNSITENGDGIIIDEINEDSQLDVSRNEITDNDSNGIHILDEIFSGAEAVIERNTISTNAGFGCQFTSVHQGSYLAFRKNEITSNTDDGVNIDNIQEGSRALFDDNTIEENDNGVYIYQITQGSLLEATENHITDNNSNGFRVEETDSGSEVTIVDDNTISENAGIGLCLGSGSTLVDSTATVRGNTISDNDQWGITVNAVHSMVGISGNDILDNGSGGSDQGGIHVDGSQLDLVNINRNNIVGNTEWGLDNDSGEMIDAEDNWWGDASGPEDPAGSVEVPDCTDDPATEQNADGTGDKVSDNVDYCPWLTSGTTITTRPPTAPSPTPTEWQVPNDFATIQAAINNAAVGDIIIVDPDTYNENLIIDKSLTIYSTDGADNTTIDGSVTIDLTDRETVIFGGSDGGFNVTGASPGLDVSLEYWSSLSIAGNSFIDTTEDSIHISYVRYFSQLDLEDNTITGSDDNGINFSGDLQYHSSIAIVDNQITGSTNNGIYFNQFINAGGGFIEGNTITGNGDGVYFEGNIQSDSQCIARDNTITGNTGYGFRFNKVQYGSYLALLDNTIDNNTDDGVFIWKINEGAEGLIEGNTIEENIDEGIFLMEGVAEGSYLAIRDNTISNSKSVAVIDQAVGTGDDNETAFYLAGTEARVIPGSETIYLDGDATTAYTMDYRGGVVIFDVAPGGGVNITADCSTGGWGIYLRNHVDEGSRLDIEDNRITQHDGDGIFIEQIDEGSDVIIQRNNISNNGGYGIGAGGILWRYSGSWATDWKRIWQGSQLDIEGNQINDNASDAINLFQLCEGSQVHVNDNTITGNGGSGFRMEGFEDEDKIDEGSVLTVRDNQISDNEVDGIFVYRIDEGSQGLFEGNTIRGHGEDGIQSFVVNEGCQILIEDNTIEENDTGIRIEEITRGSTVEVNSNRVADNNSRGIRVAIMDRNGEVIVHDNIVSGNTGFGLFLGSDNTLSNSTVTVRGNTITQNTDWGIYSSVVHSVTDVSGCNEVLNNGGGGIYINGAQLDFVGINQNSIEGNTGDGLLNDSGETLDAENNWWGDASGPGGFGPGSGVAVSADVDFIPFLTLPCGVSPEPEAPGAPRPPAAPAPDSADSSERRGAANTEVAYLYVAPNQVLPNQEVLVYVDVYNYGNQAGPCNVVLYVDGEPVGGHCVDVPANSYQRVVLTTFHAEAGNHRVTVGSHEDWFTVVEIKVPPRAESGLGGSGLGTAALIAIIAGGGVGAGLGIFFYTRRREV